MRCSGWRYGPPGPSVYGFGPEFASVEEAVACASAHLGVPADAFEEPFLPLTVDAFAAKSYEAGANVAVVDDGTYVLAHAPLPDRTAWPPHPWGYSTPG